MINLDIQNIVHTLTEWFKKTGDCVIATSGGIDSMVLAYIAHQAIPQQVIIAHSTSVSVPTLDAARVRLYAKKYHWALQLIEAGELNNTTYRSNPVNRCYYCKCSLFTQLQKLQHGALVTGTNLDDLGDYRPGLIAAKEQGVLQPYVELSINKATIRKLAEHLQLNDLKDIPASPCLASRIETGISIEPTYLEVVDKIENHARKALQTDIVRFRIRKETVALELTPERLQQLSTPQQEALLSYIKQTITPLTIPQTIQFVPYQQGSAFIGVKHLE